MAQNNDRPDVQGQGKYTTKVQDDIIKILSRVERSGHRPHEIFVDWIAIIEKSLEMLPQHTASIAATGVPADDPPEVKELWSRMREKYDHHQRETFAAFKEAFFVLLDATSFGIRSREYEDHLGSIYMRYGWPSKGNGQYFTPPDVAKMMARLTITEPIPGEEHTRLEDLVRDRLTSALEGIPAYAMATIMGVEFSNDRLLDLAILYADQITVDPIGVYDCACGSGVLLLAAAEEIPRPYLECGLVQFFGQDIDRLCVQMANINMMVYGLNGYSVKCAKAMHGLQDRSKEVKATKVKTVSPPENFEEGASGQLLLL